MADTWRELAPHFLAMLVIYVIGILAVSIVLGMRSFWSSLGVALVIAVLYPSAARSLDFAPAAWQRSSDDSDAE